MSARRCAHCGHLHRSEGQGATAIVQPRCHVRWCECSSYASHPTERASRIVPGIHRTKRLADHRTTTEKRGGSLMGVGRATGPRP